MSAYKTNIESKTLANKYYRKVLNTTPQQQLVLMNIPPGEEIGMERHQNITQFFRVEGKHSKGLAIVDGSRYYLKDGDSLTIPPDTYHNIINTSDQYGLTVYTIYSPPVHRPGTIERHKIPEV